MAKEKILLETAERRLVDSIKIDHEVTLLGSMYEFFFKSGQGPVAGFREHDNQFPGSVKGRKFLD